MALSISQSIVHLGSSSSHGGTVITASGKFNVNGILAATNGDLHSCPIPGHGITALLSSSQNKTSGKSMAKVGDKAGCGAIITTGSLDVLTA